MMERARYATLLHDLLSRHREKFRLQLESVSKALGDDASSIAIGVHPDQDQEGFLSIMVHPDTAIHLAKRKAAEPHRLLLDVSMNRKGQLSHGMPLFDPDDTPFELGDVQVDTAAEWFEANWQSIVPESVRNDVTLFGADGFGTRIPLVLSRQATE